MMPLKFKLVEFSSLFVASIIVMMYVLGIIYPDVFWGTHFLAFLPSSLQFGIPSLVLLTILYLHFGSRREKKMDFKLSKLVIYSITLLGLIIFYNLDIANDYYGDAKNFSPYLDRKLDLIPKEFWNNLFSIEFKTGHGRWGVFNLYSGISYLMRINMFQTFKLMNAIFGAGFIWVWLLAIKRYSQDTLTTIILIALGCTSPVLIIFCGHIEIYGFIMFLQVSWLYLFVNAVKRKKIILLLLSFILFLICVRFNTPSLLLSPALVLGFVHICFNNLPKVKSLFTAKKLFTIILIPLILTGFVFYFFVFADYNDSRILNAKTQDIDRLFLPLISPEAPLDTYNLLSWNHISDFLMVLFFWSPGVLFIISLILLRYKKLNWNNPLINILTLTFVLLLGFLFMINPLMSLPMDWDLYTLPFPLILMILLMVLQKGDNSRSITKTNVYTIIALQVLAIPVFIVMINKTMHSYRIESVGVRVYKTYYQHSDSFMLYALQMLEGKKRYAQRKKALLEKLKPFTRGKKDQTYAALLLDEGINAFANKDYLISRNLILDAEWHASYLKLTHEYIDKVNLEFIKKNLSIPERHIKTSDSLAKAGLIALRKQKLYKKALRDLKRASYYNPYNHQILTYKMEAYFVLENYTKALNIASQLITLKYPSEQDSLRFGIHCALEAENYDKALSYIKVYTERWPEDLFMHDIRNRLEYNEAVSELKHKFVKK
ncbi:tetratricopeptide repeat protein [Aquimarina sp. M1]